MRSHLLLLLSFIAAQGSSQITINSSNLPNAGDSLVTRNANLLTDVNLEDSGPNHSWIFGTDVIQPTTMSPTIMCNSLSQISFFDQVLLNNPFYPDYDSDFGIGINQANLGVVTFENSYQIYKNSGNVYAVTGMVATINSIPLVSQMIDRDIIYDLPLTYPASGNSVSATSFDIPTIGSYGLNQTREYICDGWGSLQIWDMTFDVLRVRSVVNAEDSIYTSFLNNGISITRPESITYEWISTEYIVPVLKITSSNGVITQVQTADIFADPNAVANLRASETTVYPNPAQSEFRVTGIQGNRFEYKLYSSTGCLLDSGVTSSGNPISVEHLSPGIYCVAISSPEGNSSHLLMKK